MSKTERTMTKPKRRADSKETGEEGVGKKKASATSKSGSMSWDELLDATRRCTLEEAEAMKEAERKGARRLSHLKRIQARINLLKGRKEMAKVIAYSEEDERSRE